MIAPSCVAGDVSRVSDSSHMYSGGLGAVGSRTPINDTEKGSDDEEYCREPHDERVRGCEEAKI